MLGLESLEQLRGLLKGQLEQETAGLTRTQMKRALLDQLAAGTISPCRRRWSKPNSNRSGSS
jgi:FKBP-type peptidyl-prolyl cis-trans isomerase (trigger factor)